MRKYMLAGIMLAITLLVAACGGSKGSPSNNNASASGAGSSKTYAELRWGEVSFLGPINYATNISPVGALVSEALVAPTLVEFAQNGTIKKSGYMASNEQVNPTTYVYHLKPVKFSDGKSLTAADVIFSLEAHKTGKESKWGTYWQNMASVSARGNSTVVVKLKKPEAVWQDILAFNSQIVEKAEAEQVGEKALGTPGHLPIGAGPWKFDSYTPEASVVVSRNPYWTGPRQPAEKITFTLFKNEASLALALRSGAVQGAIGYVTPRTFEDIPNTKELLAPGTALKFVAMNTTLTPFNNVYVRRAIADATDSQGIIKALYPKGGAEEATTIVPPSLFVDLATKSQLTEALNSLPKYSFDLAAAKRELANSPYPHGFTTTIEAPITESSSVLVAQVMSSDLAKIGIKAKVHEYTDTERSVIYGHKITIIVAEYIPGYADPEGLMQFMLLPNPSPEVPLNAAYYANPEVRQLMHENVELNDPSKRLPLIVRALHTVGVDAPYRPIYTQDTLGTLSNKYVYPTFSYWTSIFMPWALDVKLTE